MCKATNANGEAVTTCTITVKGNDATQYTLFPVKGKRPSSIYYETQMLTVCTSKTKEAKYSQVKWGDPYN